MNQYHNKKYGPIWIDYFGIRAPGTLKSDPDYIQIPNLGNHGFFPYSELLVNNRGTCRWTSTKLSG